MQKLIIWTSIQHYYGTIVIKFETLHQIESNPRTSLSWIDDSILYAFPTIFFSQQPNRESAEVHKRQWNGIVLCTKKQTLFPKKDTFFFFFHLMFSKSPQISEDQKISERKTLFCCRKQCAANRYISEKDLCYASKWKTKSKSFPKVSKIFQETTIKAQTHAKKKKEL